MKTAKAYNFVKLHITSDFVSGVAYDGQSVAQLDSFTLFGSAPPDMGGGGAGGGGGGTGGSGGSGGGGAGGGGGGDTGGGGSGGSGGGSGTGGNGDTGGMVAAASPAPPATALLQRCSSQPRSSSSVDAALRNRYGASPSDPLHVSVNGPPEERCDTPHIRDLGRLVGLFARRARRQTEGAPPRRARHQTVQPRRENKTAAEAFKAAYDEFPEPTLLYNLAQCERQLQHRPRAITLYRSYLREMPNAPNAAEVRRLASSLEQDVAREDEERRQAEAEAREQRREPAVVATPVTPPVVAPASTVPKQRPWWKNPAGWALVGVGVAAGAAGGGLLIAANNDQNAAPKAATLADARAKMNEASNFTNAGYALVGVAAERPPSPACSCWH